MESEIVKLSDIEKKLLESSTDGFEMAVFLNSYFKHEKELLVNNLFRSATREEDIGTVNFLNMIINKINLIQEERNEG